MLNLKQPTLNQVHFLARLFNSIQVGSLVKRLLSHVENKVVFDNLGQFFEVRNLVQMHLHKAFEWVRVLNNFVFEEIVELWINCEQFVVLESVQTGTSDVVVCQHCG